MRVVFFGTPLFAAHVLEYLLQNQVNIVAVISKPDRPKGRSGTPVVTPVKAIVIKQQFCLPLYQPEFVSDPEMASILQSYQADLFVVVAYGEILKQHLLDIPHQACINLHASLLPKYRGAAPIQRCMMNGETETGVTIMHMVKKMDAGDMIEQVKVTIGSEMTFGELEEKLCEVGKKALLEVIHRFEKGTIKVQSQDHSQATFSPKIELEDCEIQWTRSAQELHNLIRGVNPYPGAWCYVTIRGEKKRLKINQSSIVDCKNMQPGLIVNLNHTKENLVVTTGDQALELLDIQLEGKKRMSSEEFTRGLPRDQINFLPFS